jgi:transcriptional regulator with XRE-family HTH domain
VPTALEPSAIRVCRVLTGLTQAELAQRAGIRRETISRIERGGEPQLRVARALADALDLDVGLLFPREGNHDE